MAEMVGSPSIHSNTQEPLGGAGGESEVSVVIDHGRIGASLSLQFTEGNLMESKNFADHNAISSTSQGNTPQDNRSQALKFASPRKILEVREGFSETVTRRQCDLVKISSQLMICFSKFTVCVSCVNFNY